MDNKTWGICQGLPSGRRRRQYRRMQRLLRLAGLTCWVKGNELQGPARESFYSFLVLAAAGDETSRQLLASGVRMGPGGLLDFNGVTNRAEL